MAREATQFQVGHEKKGGIQKGQKRRSTEMVDSLFNFFEERAGDLGQSWEALDEKTKWDVYIKCLKYMVPSISSVSIEENKSATSFRAIIRNMANFRKEED